MNPKQRKIPRAVYFRYVLLNLPGLVVLVLILILVRQWVALPGWLFPACIVGWIIINAAWFPLVWRAYDNDAPTGAGTIVGERGVVKRRLDPSGFVQVRGELWRAERTGHGPAIEPGRFVRIRKAEGLTLFVSPDDGDQE